jgi:hypothetical protein
LPSDERACFPGLARARPTRKEKAMVYYDTD